MLAPDIHHLVNTLPFRARKFLNSSSWDILLSEELVDGNISARCFRTLEVPRPTYLSSTVLNREESGLLDFFSESRSLTLGPTDEQGLAQFIMRVAFSDPSNATNPVLQGVFALASLQLHGELKSFRYKHLILSSLKQSVDWLDEKTLLQNLIATMLLYHYELALELDSKGSWLVYICAVKRILGSSPAIHKLVQREYSVFLDWIYYHEALSEFAVRHWIVPYEGCGFPPLARSPRAVDGGESKVEDDVGCPTDVLQLVVHTCRRAITAKTPGMISDYPAVEQTNLLERNIAKTVGQYGPVQSEILSERNTIVADLHRLACLIYVNRAVHRVSGTEFQHRRLVREGIMLLTKMRTCQNAWPLLIIACEAADDDQRLAILDVFEQSQQDRRRRSSHIHFIQHMVESVWNQLDLNMENKVDFLTIFNAVVRGVPFIPPFA